MAEMTPEEIALGYVRPLRDTVRHRACGKSTTMGFNIAQSFAFDPAAYPTAFCAKCGRPFPVHHFTWANSDESVGS